MGRAIRAAALVAVAVVAGLVGVPGTPALAAGSCMNFSFIQYDYPGADYPVTNAKLNAEYVSIHNQCSRDIVMTNWQLRDASGHIYTFPLTKVTHERTITVHTGAGTNNPTNRYWHSTYYIWNNTGDRARLWNGSVLVDQCSWGNTGALEFRC